jgi:hypothetical protein
LLSLTIPAAEVEAEGRFLLVAEILPSVWLMLAIKVVEVVVPEVGTEGSFTSRAPIAALILESIVAPTLALVPMSDSLATSVA